MRKIGSAILIVLFIQSAFAQNPQATIEEKSNAIQPKLVEWRRHFHEFPELGNREFKTAEYVANYLKSLGLEVQTGVGKTGVVAILKGG